MSLLEQNTIKKKRVDKKIAEQLEFGNDNKKYKVKDICNSIIYVTESKIGYSSGFYYLIS